MDLLIRRCPLQRAGFFRRPLIQEQEHILCTSYGAAVNPTPSILQADVGLVILIIGWDRPIKIMYASLQCPHIPC